VPRRRRRHRRLRLRRRRVRRLHYPGSAVRVLCVPGVESHWTNGRDLAEEASFQLPSFHELNQRTEAVFPVKQTLRVRTHGQPGGRAAAMADDGGGAPPVQLPGEKPFIVRWVQKNPKSVDAILYFIFLIIFTLVVFNAQGQPTDSSPYYMIQNIRRRWGGPFENVTAAGDWFDYMIKTFVPLTFPNRWYNGEPFGDNDLGWPGGHPETYRLLGAVSIRQVRVQSGSCSVHQELKSTVPTCYGDYKQSTEDKQAFGPISDTSFGKPRYEYTTAKENGENSFTGQAATYYGGGFQLALPSTPVNGTQAAALTKILQMRDTKYIDRQTRAVFVDFTLYNPSLDYIVVVKLTAEFPASGGAFTRAYTRMVKSEHIYPRIWGIQALILECVLLFLILIYMALEVRLIMRMGFSAYFLRFWGLYDWFNFLLFWAAAGSRFHAMILAGALTFPPDSKIFVNYEPPAYYIVQWKNILAVNAFITWMKMFKYMSHIPFMTHLMKVVFAALPDTLGFICAMFFVFFGFSLSHYLAYGDEVEGFQTLNACFLTLYRQILGDFPTVDAEERSNRLLGPAFFVAWTAIASILLLNMFTAIVIDGFEKVRSEVEKIGFLHFMNNQALPPFQNALKKLRKLAEGGDDDEDSDDEGDNEMGREVRNRLTDRDSRGLLIAI